MSIAVYDRLVRPNIKNMKPYASARGTAKAMQDYLLLDAAESTYCPFSDEDEGAKYYNPLNRYPEPQPALLLERFAELYGTSPENIVISRGSEEAIRLLMQVFCAPEKEALITCPPTFAMYPIEAEIHDAINVKIPRIGEYYDRLDIEAICTIAKEPHVKIVFICNPGNPSSTSIPPEEIERLIHNLAEDCMVVIDEAYVEFAAHESFVSKINQHANLIVMRTLSKSYGAAGLRCAATIAHPQVVSYLKRIFSAYPVPRPVQLLAEEILTETRLQYMKDKQAVLKLERKRMIEALRNCSGVKRVFPSQTNFLCIEVEDAQACVQLFREHQIIIRDRSASVSNAVNVAISLKEHNDKVLKVFNLL